MRRVAAGDKPPPYERTVTHHHGRGVSYMRFAADGRGRFVPTACRCHHHGHGVSYMCFAADGRGRFVPTACRYPSSRTRRFVYSLCGGRSRTVCPYGVPLPSSRTRRFVYAPRRTVEDGLRGGLYQITPRSLLAL